MRKTLAQEVSFQGIGLHTGVPVRIKVHPSEDGIAFRLNGERTLARPENVTETTRSTKVGSVGTVEHIMSAFGGLEITDAEVELDAPELPGLDGSSLPYVRAFQEAGFSDLGEHEYPELFKRVFLQIDQVKIAIAKGTGQWRYVFHANDRWPGEQAYEVANAIDSYCEEIAPSRTFVFAEEIPMIIELGLGKGLDEKTALILGIEGYKNEAFFPDEPARHKLLDLMGDLYLSGVPVRQLSVVAERSGHRANVQAAALLAQAVAAESA
jgi:UDP-3-O-acyl-N-acetylglucosamine deacetylase